MGWNGIGIGWPNASAQATPPLPLETYLITDCLGDYDPRWSQYLPIGTLQLGQRVPTTSSTVIPTYGIIQEIGTTFGPLVAEPVENIYYDCSTQATIQLRTIGGVDSVLLQAKTVDVENVQFSSSGTIPFRVFAVWGDDQEEEVICNGFFENEIYSINIAEWTTIIIFPVNAGENEVTTGTPIIYGVTIDSFYNYGDAMQNNTTQTITPEGDLWNWTYPGQY
jgi:hypothetical protein